MRYTTTLVGVCFAFSLAACSSGHLSVELPGGDGALGLSFPAGQAVQHRLPVRISGGVRPYESSIEDCPDWVTLIPDRRILGGTPPIAEAGNTFFCTFSVTESDPGVRPARTVSYGLRLVVTAPQELLLTPPRKMDLRLGSFHSEALPVATGGVAPYTYTFTCASGMLPPGMGFAPETRTFAGTPGARFRDSCTYTATDSSQPATTVSQPVEVEVEGAQALQFPPLEKVALVVGSFHSEALPVATGGVAPYTYTFTCASGMLPPGMGFANGNLSGTPSAPFRDSCIFTVTDSSQPPATVAMTVEVEAAGVALELLSPVPTPTLSVGSRFNELFPEARGGVAPYMYSFTCDGGVLPRGMSFTNRRFSGTPSAPFRDSCTYTATDSSRPSATTSSTVAVVVEGDPEPLVLPDDVAPGNEISLEVGEPYERTLAAAAGGTLPYKYSFECSRSLLPYDMEFVSGTRVLSGTPYILPSGTPSDSCEYKVTDSAPTPEMASKTVQMELTGMPDDLTFPVNVVSANAIELTVGEYYSATLAPAAGGVPPYTYSFACDGGALPSGMNFDSDSHRFSGTPRALFDDSCTYTVTDFSSTDFGQTGTTLKIIVSVRVQGEAPALPTDVVPGNSVSLTVGQRARVVFAQASGGTGTPPYSYAFGECDLPDGLAFTAEDRLLSGTPSEATGVLTCTYSATDSASPSTSASREVTLVVNPRDSGMWRFHPRSLAGSEYPLDPTVDGRQPLVILPRAIDGAGVETYGLLDVRAPLEFNAATRQLYYVHRGSPLFGTISTFAYQVSVGGRLHDAVCVDIEYLNPNQGVPGTIEISIRDAAYWDGTRRFRCEDAPPGTNSNSLGTVSNPVHEALGPVHARRAADVAHAAVRERVRVWSPGRPGGVFAFSPAVDFGSLSGESGGFDYRGSSQSLRVGAETGGGPWQAGLIASFTQTELRYDAEASLAERGYRSGEHDTEIVSLHPFVVWHAASGGHVWASLGGGRGELRHRDDLGFPSWSGSDVRLLAYALGGSVPLTDVLSGQLEAEAGIESFAFEIKGGDRISTSLPTLRGLDYRGGLAWSAPVAGSPSVSVAYRHLTGDGSEGARVDVQGSVSFTGVLDPRLTLTGSAEGSLGLGDLEHKSWRLGGGLRFAPHRSGHGFGVRLDTGLASGVSEGSSSVSMRGEVGYGLQGGPFFGTVRPYVGLIRDSGDHSVRQTLGLDLGRASNWRVKVEVYEYTAGDPRAFQFSLRHRF